MRSSFPSMLTHPVPASPPALAAALQALVDKGDLSDGWVRAITAEGELFLFLHRGKPYAAGALEDGRFVPRSFGQFFGDVAAARGAELCRVDIALILCMAVLFRKAPAVQVNVAGLAPDTLLKAIRETETDSVLLARREEAYSLCFCRKGEPVELFPATGEVFPDAPTVAERIAGYAAMYPTLLIDIYDDIQLGPAPGAGKAIGAYLAEIPSAAQKVPPVTLLVRLGGRVVFRYDMSGDSATIGRGGDNDLALDNLSVSRKHARVHREGETLLFEDLGSENGLVVKGNKLARASIAPGGDVAIGKYLLTYVRRGSFLEKAAVGAPVQTVAGAGPSPLDETIAVGRGDGPITIESGGQLYKMRGLVFTIGKAPDSHLRISGWFVAPTHVRIMRSTSGAFTATHLAGGRAMRVNGKAVRTVELADGDVIEVGAARCVFRKPGPAGGAAALGPGQTPAPAASIGPRK